MYLVGSQHELSLRLGQNAGVFRAEDGQPGGGKKRTGADGKERIIKVPLGTEVWEGEKKIGVLMQDDERLLVARGGTGGWGNVHFVGAIRQAPLLHEAGESGEEKKLRLEVKHSVDVALVGGPGVGKTALLNQLAGTRWEIGTHPFSTIEVLLGVYHDGAVEVTFVEIPALVAGAHRGKGLGNTALKHAERARVLVYVLDAAQGNIHEQLGILTDEIAEYDKGLETKASVVLVNRVDVREGEEAGIARKVWCVSATTGYGVKEARDEILQRVRDASTQVHMAETMTSPEPERRREIRIEREGEVFVVRHRRAEQVAAATDLINWTALGQFRGLLRTLGVTKALERAGVKAGQTVRVAGKEFEW